MSTTIIILHSVVITLSLSIICQNFRLLKGYKELRQLLRCLRGEICDIRSQVSDILAKESIREHEEAIEQIDKLMYSDVKKQKSLLPDDRICEIIANIIGNLESARNLTHLPLKGICAFLSREVRSENERSFMSVLLEEYRQALYINKHNGYYFSYQGKDREVWYNLRIVFLRIIMGLHSK